MVMMVVMVVMMKMMMMMMMMMKMKMGDSVDNLRILTATRSCVSWSPQCDVLQSKVQGPLHIAGRSKRSQGHCSKDPIWRTKSGHAVVQRRGEEPC